MKYIALAIFIYLFTATLSFAFPAQGQTQVSAPLPVAAKLIGYEKAKQICCYEHENNGWCWRMTPHLRVFGGIVYDRRSESVPAEAESCA